MNKLFLIKWGNNVLLTCDESADGEGLGPDCEVWEIGIAGPRTPRGPLMTSEDPATLTGVRPIGVPANDRAKDWKSRYFAERFPVAAGSITRRD